MNKKFSLIELLLVVAIIGVLASLLLPTLGKARRQAQSAVCKSNLKQLSTAIYTYAMDNKNYAPADNKSTSSSLQWHRTLSETGYVSFNYEDESSVYVCPNGSPLSANWENNYGLNFRLGRGDGSGSFESLSTNYKYLSSMRTDHGSETMLIMDSFNKFRFVQSVDMNVTRLLENTPHIARHVKKANLAYLDGHVGVKSYNQLLSKNEFLDNFWTP